jgi:hypothetical protein
MTHLIMPVAHAMHTVMWQVRCWQVISLFSESCLQSELVLRDQLVIIVPRCVLVTVTQVIIASRWSPGQLATECAGFVWLSHGWLQMAIEHYYNRLSGVASGSV